MGKYWKLQFEKGGRNDIDPNTPHPPPPPPFIINPSEQKIVVHIKMQEKTEKDNE